MKLTDRIPSRSLYLSISLGVAYGVALRVLLDVPAPQSSDSVLFQGLVSISFFVVVPIAIGFITIFLGDAARSRSLIWALLAPWLTIFVFLVTCVLLLLEGSICVAVVLPGFLVLSSLGGALAWWVTRLRAPRTSTLCAVVLMPVLVSPIEGAIPRQSHVRTVETSIRIMAPTDVVWAEITDVGRISRDELSFGLTRLMGAPQPLEAHMEITESGWVRKTSWERGIEFREIITDSSPAEVLRWDFDFPAEAIPEGVMDEHVRIGGRYFKLLEGGYRLDSVDDGSTVLTLSTTYEVTARPTPYALFWARIVMSDFHRMILDLIRDRSEAQAG